MFTATRKLGIDAAHRVPLHNSKCRNLHGHRYEIEVTISAETLTDKGSETGMVKDFAFLKQVMESEIEAKCDHGTICAADDLLVLRAFYDADMRDCMPSLKPNMHEWALRGITRCGAHQLSTIMGKLYIVPFVPTAENLARHWHMLLNKRLSEMQMPQCITRVRVWETPNCFAEFSS